MTTHYDLPSEELMIRSPCEATFQRTLFSIHRTTFKIKNNPLEQICFSHGKKKHYSLGNIVFTSAVVESSSFLSSTVMMFSCTLWSWAWPKGGWKNLKASFYIPVTLSHTVIVQRSACHWEQKKQIHPLVSLLWTHSMRENNLHFLKLLHICRFFVT